MTAGRTGMVHRGTERITPRAPGPLAGYASRGNAVAQGTGDELEATLVVWSGTDGTAVAWLSIDAVAVTTRLRDALVVAVRDGFVDESLTVLVCASHTHSAPQGWTGDIHPGLTGRPDPAMVDELVEHVHALAGRVHAGAGVAVVPRWIRGPVPGVGANRHRPSGPHDSSAGVLVLAGAQTGSPEAIVVDFACHPTVLPATNLDWSADWPGAGRSVTRAALQLAAGPGEPSILFLQGAAGDASTRFIRRSADADEVARIGTVFGGTVAALSQRATELTVHDLRVRRGVVALHTRALPSVEAARALVESCESARAAADPDPNDPQTRRAQTRLEGARVQLALATGSPPPTVELPVTVVSVGEIAWVHVPLELFASLGLHIKDQSPYDETRVVGYTDGYFGYLADAEAHRAGTYEALSSLFDVDASEAFVSQVVAELHRAHSHLDEGPPCS